MPHSIANGTLCCLCVLVFVSARDFDELCCALRCVGVSATSTATSAITIAITITITITIAIAIATTTAGCLQLKSVGVKCRR